MEFRISFFVFLAIAVPFSRVGNSADPVRIDVTRDAWISAYSGEQEGNNGAAPRLKLKGIQEFFLIDFDALPYKGKRVSRAELRIKSANEDSAMRVTVSTVMTEWNEGTGNGYSKESDGCSFLWAIAGKKRWGGDGTDVTSVTLGNGGSIWSFGDASQRDSEGWQRIPVSPEVMQSKLNGDSFGFLVMDDVGSEYRRDGNRFEYRLMPNRFFYSRDQNRASAPYFVVWFDETVSVSPEPASISLAPSSQDRSGKEQNSEAASTKPSLGSLSEVFRAAKDSADGIASTSKGMPIFNVDGKQRARVLTGMARGETLSWVVDVPPGELQIDAPDGFEIDKFVLPKIENQLDPAIPINRWDPKTLGLAPDTQVLTAIDIYATKSLKPGDYKIGLKSSVESVSMTIRVWGFQLPDQLSFIPQMNCYGLPENERSFYELCHQHRTTLNSLRYGWTGKVSQDAVPRKKSDGTWDWSEWDRKWGPLFDGSAFANSRRGPVPIEAFYLPINENWPMDHEKHFQGGYWIENAYSQEYWNEFRGSVREFANHLEERNYRNTLFEFYLNNKVYFKEQRGGRWDGCSAPWVFDEPVNTQDFWALRKFGIEFWKGVENVNGPRFGYRVDISRPQWQRDLLDGVSSVEVVSGALRQYQTRIVARAEEYNNLVYMYGAANSFDQSSVTNIAWCVETWARGANGVVPWQTMGTKESWKKLDPLSVIYPSDFGAIPSLRLKSFRDGQQLVEYLEAFRVSTGLSKREIGAMLLEEFGLIGQTVKLSEEDAGSVRFGPRELEQLGTLRWALGEYLDKHASSPDSISATLKARNGLQLKADRKAVAIEFDP
ncbi:MAG: DUF4091 domain-containing protein [Pirellula sp.]|jgi:hypothetical protein|nr:DUF4091 domain-containing protein [Pirellula sp.]